MLTRMRTVILATTDADRAAAFEVRTTVFVHEQGVPVELELDDLDQKADHFLAVDGGRAVGAARLVLGDGDRAGVLGRLAVLPQARGTGLGAALVRAVEDRARALGLGAVRLHSQTHACAFYRRLGYQAYGEEEMEAGIPHIWMRKPLVRP